MVSWSTFWISQDAVPARAGICITTILTLITMLGVVNTNMPKVSYIKAIDLYLLMSFIFVFASLVEYIIVLNFRNCYSKEKKKAKNEQAETENDHVVHKVICYKSCFPNVIFHFISFSFISFFSFYTFYTFYTFYYISTCRQIFALVPQDSLNASDG